MARGFESKDVEYQQAEAERRRTPGPSLTPEERERESRRKTLELALANARANREHARSDAQRQTFDRAISALEADLRTLGALVLLVASFWIAACGPRTDANAPPAAAATPPATSTPSASTDPVSTRRRIVALGDSLTAGLGLAPSQAYPTLLQQRLDAASLDFEVVNAGVSGDTSAGGLERLDWALQGDVRILIVALGGNDALRGLSAEALKANLAQIIERAQAKKIRVILAGMEAPPNYGRDYIVSFHQVYPALAQQYKVAFVPFLLQNVAGIPGLNQPDGIHPTAAGARVVADNVWTVLKPMAEGIR